MCPQSDRPAIATEPWPLVQTPEPACRLEPVLLLHRKLQSASNFLMSYCFLLFVLNIADWFGQCADYRRHSEIARFLAHRECLKLVWSFLKPTIFFVINFLFRET